MNSMMGVESVRPCGWWFDAGLGDQRDVAAELAITLGDHARVLVPGHHVVGIAVDVQQRHLGLGQRLPDCRPDSSVGQRFGFVREAVAFQDQLPVAGAALAFALAARPALEVADGRVRVDAGHLVRIRRRPVVAVQPAAAQPDQRGFLASPYFSVSSR